MSLSEHQKDDLWDEIRSRLGNSYGDEDVFESIAEKFGISVEEVQENMVDSGWERCPDCEQIVECGELADEDGEEQACDECRA